MSRVLVTAPTIPNGEVDSVSQSSWVTLSKSNDLYKFPSSYLQSWLACSTESGTDHGRELHCSEFHQAEPSAYGLTWETANGNRPVLWGGTEASRALLVPEWVQTGQAGVHRHTTQQVMVTRSQWTAGSL